ncbi:hypothetical protein GCK72_003190 [Caenorhabditis remanei]|uniref:Uncharacterized protein n=1 Tax=Caenorhabditis remanei TaxID=31234 RepID=A0A6A5HWW8_CAERE|nr:hypothetical protein GCK72_003190 [Caenorhabditis remanei]KAF1771364.1 hypothetical protein GCK72_003190 [Caenorhabditis remanei]
MNTSIGIALLFLLASAQSVFGDELENREKVLNLNRKRLELAKRDQIANMHEVTWDATLGSKLEHMTCDELASPGSDYVVFGFFELGKGDRKSPPLHPLQTKFACEATKCDDEPIMCIMGPKNSRAKESDIKYGSPGTGCTGGNGLSGLCMGGGSGAGAAMEKVPVEKQSEKAPVEKQ